MKLLHTSDWHLGMTFRNGVTYYEDQEYAIDRICKIAVDRKVDGILIAGDVFDKSIASQDGIRLLDQKMNDICGGLQIPVCMIAGNHDGAERLAQHNRLLKKSGLYIAGVLQAEPQVVRMQDVDIYLLPWISTDKVRTIYPEDAESVRTLEDAYRVVLDHYRGSFAEGQKNILVAHAYITNAETSVSDRAAEVGRATMVGAGVFEGFDYVALGHLHGPQKINERIRYSGTPMAYSFGKEERQEKSVVIIDTDTWEIELVPLPQLHKRTTLTGTYDELLRADYDDEILQGYVRLEVTDSYVGNDLISRFREIYKNLLEISGKSMESGDSRITMSVEEFEQADTDPEAVFSQYCKDMLEEMPGDHWLELFRGAYRAYEEEVSAS